MSLKFTWSKKPAPALNTARPLFDISSVSAVIELPPSLPLKIMSLYDTVDFITASVEEFVISINVVPASLNLMSPPSASRKISPPASNSKSLDCTIFPEIYKFLNRVELVPKSM